MAQPQSQSQSASEPYRVSNVVDLALNSTNKRYKISAVTGIPGFNHESVLASCTDGSLRLFTASNNNNNNHASEQTKSKKPNAQSSTVASIQWTEHLLSDNFCNKLNVDQLDSIQINNNNSVLVLCLTDLSLFIYSIKLNNLSSMELNQIQVIDLSAPSVIFQLNKFHYNSINHNNNTGTSLSINSPLLLAIATKKKQLLLYRWNQSNESISIPGQFTLVSDKILLNESARAIEFCSVSENTKNTNNQAINASICLGLKRDYNVLHYNGSTSNPIQMNEIFPIGKRGQAPLATPIRAFQNDPQSLELLLVQDNAGICIDSNGKPSRKQGVIFSDLVQAIVYSQPHCIAIINNSNPNIPPSSACEIRNLANQPIQAILFNQQYKSISRSNEYYFIANSSSIKSLVPVPLIELLDQLIASKSIKEAIAYVSSVSETQLSSSGLNRQSVLNDLYLLLAYFSFNSGDYERSMYYFQQSNVDPSVVLALFPDILPVGQLNQLNQIAMNRLEQRTVGRSLNLNQPQPVRVLHSTTGSHNSTAANNHNPSPSEQALLKALAALIPFLTQQQSKLRNTIDLSQLNLNENFNPSQPMPLPVLIDTVLLKSYLLADLPLIPFLQTPNYCSIFECDSLLRAYEKYPELIALFQSRSMHRQALELLQTMGSNASNNHNPNSAAAQLSGVGPTVRYLQHLCQNLPTHSDSLKLILEFSRWVLNTDIAAGLSIFTACHSNNTIEHQQSHSHQCIPPLIVLEHLKKACADRSVCCEYLESLITVFGETAAQFHNELIALYLQSILKLKKQAQQRIEARKEMEVNHSVGSQPDLTADQIKINQLRMKLIEFLRQSSYYTAEKMLSKFPRDDLYHERALLLSRINQHGSVLFIYSQVLNDYAAAEEYCNSVYQQQQAMNQQITGADADSNSHSNSADRNIYLTLLRVYLKPQTIENNINIANPHQTGNQHQHQNQHQNQGQSSSSYPVLLEPALSLLERYSSLIDPAAAIELLPVSLELSSLYPYLNSVILRLIHSQRENAIKKHLKRAEHLAIRAQFLESARVRIHIESDTVCSKCNKKIGNSAFARYPDGALMHYVCYTLQ